MASVAERFLRALWGEELPGLLLVWTLKTKRSIWYSDIAKAARYINGRPDVYIGVGLAGEDLGPTNRAKADQITALPGLWCDIDIASPVHKKANLPPTLEDALAVVNAPGLPPSLVVHSGHGIHAHWLWRECLVLDTPEERAKAAALSQAFQDTLQVIANARGWVIDSVGDLSRVLRPPGSINAKDPQNLVQVKLLSESDARYSPSDFEAVLLAPEPGAKRQSPSEIVVGPLILAADAQPPFDLFQALLDNNTKFRQSWEAKRADRSFPSASEYEMSLLSLAAQAGWTDQQLADLAIAFRRKQAVDLKLNERRYQNEIRKARATAGQVPSPDGSYAAVEDLGTASPEDEAEPPEDPVVLKQERMAQISEMLFKPWQLARCIKRLMDPRPMYVLVLELRNSPVVRREVLIGEAKDLANQGTVLNAIFDAISIKPFAPLPSKVWLNVQNLLGSLWEEEDLGPEAKLGGQGQSWVRNYLTKKTILQDWKTAIKEGSRYPYLRDGAIYLSAEDFSRFLQRTYQEKKGGAQLGLMLRAAGLEPTRHFSRDSKGIRSAAVWRVPAELAPFGTLEDKSTPAMNLDTRAVREE